MPVRYASKWKLTKNGQGFFFVLFCFVFFVSDMSSGLMLRPSLRVEVRIHEIYRHVNDISMDTLSRRVFLAKRCSYKVFFFFLAL